jgi:hypothetical protein
MEILIIMIILCMCSLLYSISSILGMIVNTYYPTPGPIYDPIYYSNPSPTPSPIPSPIPSPVNLFLVKSPVLSLNKKYYYSLADEGNYHKYLYTADGKPVSVIANGSVYYLVVGVSFQVFILYQMDKVPVVTDKTPHEDTVSHFFIQKVLRNDGDTPLKLDTINSSGPFTEIIVSHNGQVYSEINQKVIDFLNLL